MNVIQLFTIREAKGEILSALEMKILRIVENIETERIAQRDVSALEEDLAKVRKVFEAVKAVKDV